MSGLTIDCADDIDADGPGSATTGSGGGGSSLLTSLVASWKLDNTSDSAGSNTLTNNNTVTFNTGKIGNAGYFTATSNQYLSLASNANVVMGDVSFTIGAWVYLASATAHMEIVAKDAASGRDYRLYYNKDAIAIKFSTLLSGVDLEIHSGVTLSTGTWYCVIAWFDSTTDIGGVVVDNNTPVTASWVNGTGSSSTEFCIGRRTYSGFEEYWDGRIDNVNIWKKALTSDERLEFYNSGAGREYPFT